MVFLTVTKSRGWEGFEEEDNEFLFVLCAGEAVWVAGKSVRLCWAREEGVVGLRVVGRGRQGPAQLVSGGEST